MAAQAQLVEEIAGNVVIAHKFFGTVVVYAKELVEVSGSCLNRLGGGIWLRSLIRRTARPSLMFAEEIIGSDSCEETARYLTDAFEKRYHPQSQARIFGLLFTHPEEPIAKAQIFPRLRTLDLSAGKHVDFFIAGYRRDRQPEFDPEAFERTRAEIQRRSSWKYSGDTDLLLAMARYRGGTTEFDLSEFLHFDIGKIIEDRVYLSAPRLFEDIFRFCEEHPVNSDVRELSDWIGMKRVGPHALEAIIDTLSKVAGEIWRKGRHFAVIKGQRESFPECDPSE